MSTYAQRIDVENYMDSPPTDPLAIEKALQRAERDLEPYLMPVSVNNPPTQVISLFEATGGDFTVSWHGSHPQTTAGKSFDVTAADLQSALAAFTDIGINLTVLGQSPVWTLLWNTDWAWNNFTNLAVPPVTVDTSALEPDNPASVVQIAGRKINPVSDLDVSEQLALANAVCAQVEYRLAMGPAFFIKPQYGSVRGPDFSTQGKLPLISPKARRELAETGLLLRGGRAVAGYARRGVAKGWANY